MAEKCIKTLVYEMAAREAIRELPLKYCHYIWKKNVLAIVDLFTEDGEFDLRGGDGGFDAGGAPLRIKGRAALLKYYPEGLASLDPHPFIHNHVFEMHAPDRATGKCYMDMIGSLDGKMIRSAGCYDDEYAKVNGEWKFRSRKFNSYYFGPRDVE